MLTVEEAWAALETELRWPGRVAMCRDIDGEDADLGWLTDEQAGARALALAVWEEGYAAHYPCTRDQLCGPHAERLARIKALGSTSAP